MKLLASFFLLKGCHYIITCAYKNAYGYTITFIKVIKPVSILFRVEYFTFIEGKLNEVQYFNVNIAKQRRHTQKLKIYKYIMQFQDFHLYFPLILQKYLNSSFCFIV